MEKKLFKLLKNSSVGIPDIDTQHRQLINLGCNLSQMCRKRERLSEIEFAMLVKQTLYFVNYHIKYEGKLMEETAYPGMDAHKEFHNVFFLNFLKQIRAFEARDSFVPENLSGILYEWMNSHFLMDADLGQHINKGRKRNFPGLLDLFHSKNGFIR